MNSSGRIESVSVGLRFLVNVTVHNYVHDNKEERKTQYIEGTLC